MHNAGDVISYLEMCREWGASFQRGMYFKLRGPASVLLMSRRRDAVYEDQVQDNGKILIYEGHDAPRLKGGPDPKRVDQPAASPSGMPTQNQLFYQAAQRFKRGEGAAEPVQVYEKVHAGIWVYNGTFQLIDAWRQQSGERSVFKFKLSLVDAVESLNTEGERQIEQTRLIPTSVKLAVWKRDKGKCCKCGSKDNLHFDHILPYSKGGSSLVAKNIQLLCVRHNLEKRDKIE
ncbi:MAG TPA: HNH endonuclease [Candidatus Acidoferrales bacterium]|nr:HNH endonuclease [Candidatus Acidoferrales bacterium]